MKSDMYRQGDVLIRRVKAIPSTAKIEPFRDRVVLAHGEVTGHAHAFYTDRVRMFRDSGAGSGGTTFIRVEDGGADLKHEEHATIAVPAGDFEVIQQSEYHPEAIRSVQD